MQGLRSGGWELENWSEVEGSELGSWGAELETGTGWELWGRGLEVLWDWEFGVGIGKGRRSLGGVRGVGGTAELGELGWGVGAERGSWGID